MDFGIIPCFSWPTDQGSPAAQYQQTLKQARTAAESGYDSIWTGQRYLRRNDNGFQPIPLLSRYAGFAGEMDLGTSIFLLPLHNPVLVAENFATIEQSFEGGIQLGVALGYKDAEFEAFGIPKEERVGRLIEGIQLIRKLWTEEQVSFSGKYYEVTDASIHPRAGDDGCPPIHIGANHERGVERAGKLGDGWIISARTSFENAKALSKVYRNAAGADGRISMNREVFVADTTEEAVEIAKPALVDRLSHYLDRDVKDLSEADLDDQIQERVQERFIGSPEECIDRIAKYQEQVGVEQIICMYNWRILPNDAMVDSIRTFGEKVLPYFEDEQSDL